MTKQKYSDIIESKKKVRKLPQKNQNKDKNEYNKMIKDTYGNILYYRSKKGRSTYIPPSRYSSFVNAKLHNRSMNEIKCQNLINEEQKYYMYKNYFQSTLERNIRKYKKTGDKKYKDKISYYGQLVNNRNKYLDYLYNVSRKIENKSINEYLKLKNSSINLTQAKETVDDIKIPNNIQKQDVKNTLKTIFKRRISRFNLYIPKLGLGNILYAKRHNKSIREVYCQNLIKRERLHLLHKSNYHQDRLDRNVKKYKDKQKTRYKRRIERHWAKVKKRQEYQDLLYTTSRAIDNKVVNKYEQINQTTKGSDVSMSELRTGILDNQGQDTLKQNHQETEQKILKSEPTLTNDKKETNNSQEAQQKLKENLIGANESFDKNKKEITDTLSPEQC